MNRIRSMVLLLCLLLLLMACGMPGDTAGTDGMGASPINDTVNKGIDVMNAAIRGNITELQQADGVVNTVRIEGELEDDTQYDRAMVTITDETRIFRQEGQERVAATVTDLQGQRVEADFTGPVMESYPVQATASEIVILE
jgi:hypothetical protein